jgi:two-component system copper resistance phosphate regulon response regulator CusR
MRLLVVEDDEKLAGFLRRGLHEARFVVDAVADGASALRALTEVQYDLVVLDLMLPVVSGIDVLRRMRAAGNRAPVVVLSARDSVEDRVSGLQAGADDYVVKPFAFVELLARVRTILRRGPQRQEEITRVADLEMDLPRHKVTRGGAPIELTAKEFQLLSFLARRAGEVLSRTKIAEQVWDMNFDGDANTVEVTVRRLRAKVDDPFEQKLIHTVRGVGYVLEAR